jgi:hypothetical protein
MNLTSEVNSGILLKKRSLFRCRPRVSPAEAAGGPREWSMPKIEVNDEQILSCLDQLSPAAKRAALAKLIAGLEQLDGLVDRNREKLEALCRKRGVDFSRLTEEEREVLVDEILHSVP